MNSACEHQHTCLQSKPKADKEAKEKEKASAQRKHQQQQQQQQLQQQQAEAAANGGDNPKVSEAIQRLSRALLMPLG